MLIAGLTGGLACGKTQVGKAFHAFGCHVVEADALGHDVIAPGGECHQAVIDTFGTADRAALARIVFADPAQLSKLNGIVHPAVRRRAQAAFAAIAREDPHAIGIYVAAILVEIGAAREFDKLILVNCAREQQIERAMARGATERDVLARLERQLPAEKKLPWADYVIDTSGPIEETLRQTKMVYAELREIAL